MHPYMALLFATLNTGAPIPVLGMGTSFETLLSFHDMQTAIVTAIEVGYRHFDTASLYGSEAFLGKAIKEAIEKGLVKREDLFITSKLWCADAYPQGVLPAIPKSLRELELEYLDLYLVHWPVRIKQGVRGPPKPEELLPFDMEGTWKAMEECAEKGLARAIGVSNFSSTKLQRLLSSAKIPPAVNQVEMHPKWQQKKLREFCKTVNVHISAFSPLGAPSTFWGSPAILDDPIIKDIALKHGKTPAQVVLRWALDQGVSIIPKSFNAKRMLEKFQVFDWQLTGEDHKHIGEIERKRNVDGQWWCSPLYGSYKSIQEFWDGEY